MSAIIPPQDLSPYLDQEALWHLEPGEYHTLVTPDWSFTLDFNAMSSSGISNGILSVFKKPKKPQVIYDVTAGLGRDSLSLALLGYEVHSVEPHPVLMCLMQEAYQRMFHKDCLNWHFHYHDLQNMLVENRCSDADIIYFDPMFESRKMAKPQKYTQVLQQFAHQNNESYRQYYRLLLEYCQKNGIKLIVKQPRNRKAAYIERAHQELHPNKSTVFLIYAFSAE